MISFACKFSNPRGSCDLGGLDNEASEMFEVLIM
jgi:hypothetical protein